jgi:hypothetical protein
VLHKITTHHQSPSKALNNYINRYWISLNNTKEIIKIPIVPDGCIDIIFKNAVFGNGEKNFQDAVFGNGEKNFSNVEFGNGNVYFIHIKRI